MGFQSQLIEILNNRKVKQQTWTTVKTKIILLHELVQKQYALKLLADLKETKEINDWIIKLDAEIQILSKKI